MTRALMILLLLAGTLSVTGCSDDGGGNNPFFKVTIEVEDSEGRPVPGLNLELTSDNPYLQDFRRAKAVTAIQFTVPRSSQAFLVVEDITGKPVRELVDGVMMAGRHQIHWDGRDASGVHQPSGRYTVRLIGFNPDSGLPEFEDTIDVLMCLVDPYDHPIGTTDEDGRVILKDKRHFPHLYDRDPMTATNENGEAMGLLEPTADMLVALGDTAGGGTMIVRREIPGQGLYRFVWSPGQPMPRVTEEKTEGSWEQGADIPPPVVWKLGPVLPNPYN